MGRTSAISVSSLRFTLPSPIHFGYGVAYRASPGAKASRVRPFTRRALRQYPPSGLCVPSAWPAPGLQVDSCELVSSKPAVMYPAPEHSLWP